MSEAQRQELDGMLTDMGYARNRALLSLDLGDAEVDYILNVLNTVEREIRAVARMAAAHTAAEA